MSTVQKLRTVEHLLYGKYIKNLKEHYKTAPTIHIKIQSIK